MTSRNPASQGMLCMHAMPCGDFRNAMLDMLDRESFLGPP